MLGMISCSAGSYVTQCWECCHAVLGVMSCSAGNELDTVHCNNKNPHWQDKYKRALAEGENTRKRMTKQVEDAKSFAIQSFCKDLLDVSGQEFN